MDRPSHYAVSDNSTDMSSLVQSSWKQRTKRREYSGTTLGEAVRPGQSGEGHDARLTA